MTIGIEELDYIPEGLEESQLNKNIPKGYLSYTQIDLYRQCPKKYEKRYIYNIRPRPSWFVIKGKVIHKAIEYINRLYIENKQIESPEIKDFLFSHLKSSSFEIDKELLPDSYEEEVEVIYDKNLIAYINNISKVNPIETEVQSIIEIDDVPIVEYIDIIRRSSKGNTFIGDYKIVDRYPRIDQITKKYYMQLGLYSIGKGIENTQIFIVHPKVKSEIGMDVSPTVKFTQNQRDNVISIVRGVINNIKAGNFPADPRQDWVCTKKYCPYYDICKERIG